MKKFLFFLCTLFTIGVYSQNIMVVGAGDPTINGIYIETGTYNGHPQYIHSSDPNLKIIYAYSCMFYCRWEIINTMWPAPAYENNSTAAIPPFTGWEMGMMGNPPAPTLMFVGPYLTYNTSYFQEPQTDDGSLLGTTNIQIDLDVETFTGANGEDFLSNNKASIIDLPPGMNATLIRTSDSTISLNITGNAASHNNINDGTFELNFLDAAFSGNDSSLVYNHNHSFEINFIQQNTVGSNADFTTIASALSGSDKGDILYLTGETFTESGLNINHDLTIIGMGATQTIVQGDITPNSATAGVFRLANGINARIEKITIRHGNVNSNTGGGIYISGAANLILRDCEVRDNYAEWGGGGIFMNSNIGTTNIYNCTIAGNSINTTNGSGGGIDAESGTLYIENTTISQNQANVGAGIRARFATLVNCTVTDNTAFQVNSSYQGGGGIFSSNNINLKNTIVAGNYDPTNEKSDIMTTYGSITSMGNNIIGNVGIGGFASNTTGDIYFDPYGNTTPNAGATETIATPGLLLGPLDLNNAETRTHSILAGSIAIDPTSGNGANIYDQRHALRVNTADIGAFEYNATICSTTINTQDINTPMPPNGIFIITPSQINNNSITTCGPLNFSLSQTTFTCSDIGTNIVMLIATDTLGFIRTAPATVTITDTIAPVISGLSDTTVTINNMGCTANIDLGTPIVSDICLAAITNDAPANFTAGTTTVTWTATDFGNNSSTFIQTVTVTNDLAFSVVSANETCANLNDGSIDLTVTGGSAPYSYNWNNGAYLSEDITGLNDGSYSCLITDVNGCTLTDTIHITSPLPLDNTTINSGFTITSNQVSGQYQWIDCNTMTPVTGATDQIFNATYNGSFAVIVSQNTCTDTSACVTVAIFGIDDLNVSNNIHIYPNPSDGNFTISGIEGSYSIMNELGQKIYTAELNSSNNSQVNLSGFVPGMYFLQYRTSNNSTATKKIIIQ